MADNDQDMQQTPNPAPAEDAPEGEGGDAVADALHIAGKGFEGLDDGQTRENGDPADPSGEDEVFGNANIQTGRRQTFEQVIAGQAPEGETLADQPEVVANGYQGSEPDSEVETEFEAPQPPRPAAATAPDAGGDEVPPPVIDERPDTQAGPVEEVPQPGLGDDGDEGPQRQASAVTTGQTGGTPETPPVAPPEPEAPVAEDPALLVADGDGVEDLPLRLDIEATLGDTDGAEILDVVIEGVPSGFSFVDGNGQPVGTLLPDGSWSFTGPESGDLWLVRPEHWSGDLDLTVRATATETNGDTAVVTADMNVHVEAVADAPVLATSDLALTEGEEIPLDIRAGLIDGDGSESLDIYVTGVPDHATLSAGTRLDAPLTVGGVTMPAGTWVLASADLADLKAIVPPTVSMDMNLNVYAAATESANGDVAITGPSPIHVDIGVRAPEVAGSGSGQEGQWADLDLSASVTSADGTETMTVFIQALPEDAELRRADTGEVLAPNADGSYDVTGLLDRLQVRWEQDGPMATSDRTIAFNLRAVVTDTDVGTANETPRDTNQSVTRVRVDVSGVANPVTIESVSAGLEDQAGGIPFAPTITLQDTDGSERLTGTIRVEFAADEAGTLEWRNGTPIPSTVDGGVRVYEIPVDSPNVRFNAATGTYTLTNAVFRPEADNDADPAYTIRATTLDHDGSTRETVLSGQSIAVDAVADPVTVAVSAPAIAEDGSVTPTVTASFGDHADGSETHTLTLTAPAGWTPTALNGWTDNGDGTYSRTVTGGSFDGDGPTFDAPADSDVDGTFSVVAKAEETNTSGAEASAANNVVTAGASTVVEVDAVADPVTVAISAPTIGENGSVTPTVTATFGDHQDGSETHSLVITAPAGWAVSDLNGWTDNGDGTYTLTVSGGSFTGDAPTFDAPAASDVAGTFSVQARAEETDTSGAEASAANNLATADASTVVNIVAAADPVTVAITAGDIAEDGAVTPTVTASFGDVLDGSETHTLVITAPAGWTPTALNGWTDNGDGTYSRTVTASDMTVTDGRGTYTGDGPAFDAPADSDVDGTFSVVATAVEDANGSTLTASASTVVEVDAVADPVTVAITAGNIAEDGAVTPHVTASFGDHADGSETHTLVITAPAGWTPTALNGWSDNGDGTYSRTVTGGSFDGDGPAFDAPADSDVDGTFSVVATAEETDLSGEEASAANNVVTASASTVVEVDAVADPVTVALSGAGSIEEDGSITPSVTATFGDVRSTDGSETHTLTLTAPAGWTATALNGWTDNGDGTFTLTLGEGDFDSVTTVDGQSRGTFTGDAPTFQAPDNTSGSASFSIRADAEETTTSGAEATVGNNTAFATDQLDLEIVAVADEATISGAGVGIEDKLVDLDLSIEVNDSSEVVSAITLNGLPAGARLWDSEADGGNGAYVNANPDGSYSLEPGAIAADGSLTRYQMDPPPDASGTYTLTLSVTTLEPSSNDTTTVSQPVEVRVFGDADVPTLQADDPDVAGTQEPVRSVDEGELVQLTWGAGGLVSGDTGEAGDSFPASVDGSETVMVRIRVPDGDMADFRVVVDGQEVAIKNEPWPDGQSHGAYWEVSGADLAAGKVHIGGQENWGETGGEVRFELTPITTEGDAGAAVPDHLSRAETAQGNPTYVKLVVDQDADQLTLVADTVGDEDAGTPDQAGDGIVVSPQITLQDTDGSESLTGNVEFVFDAGDAAAGSLVWIPADAAHAGLFNAPAGGVGTYTLDADAFIKTGDTYTIDPSIGRLEFVPTEHWSGEVTYTLRATSLESDGDTQTSELPTATITVNAVADEPPLSTTDGAGMENTAIAFDIDSSLVDTDGSETLYVYISDVPKGAVIEGAVPGELEKLSGSVTLPDGTVLTVDGGHDVYRITLDDNTEAQAVLSGLTVTPPTDDSADFVMNVHAVTVEPNGSTAVASDSVRIDVGTNAPDIAVNAGGITTSEDTAYTLTATDLQVVNQFETDGEDLQVFIKPQWADGTPVPTNYVYVQVPKSGGGWKTISPVNGEYDISDYMNADGSANVKICTTGNKDANFQLGVRARIEDEDFNSPTFHTDETDMVAPDAQEATAVIDVTVRAVADAPSVSGGGAALEDTDWVDMNIEVKASGDTDSEALTQIKIFGVPSGVTLRIPDGDGGYTVLTPDTPGGSTYTFNNPSADLIEDLKDLQASFPDDSHNDISFKVSATSTEYGTDGEVLNANAQGVATATKTQTVVGKIYGVADEATLVVDGDTSTAGVQDVERVIAEDSFYQIKWGTYTDQTGQDVTIGAQSGEAGSAFGTGTSLDGSETVQYVKIWPADAGDNGIARLAISSDGTIDPSEVQELPAEGYWTVSLSDLQNGRVHVGAEGNWASSGTNPTLSFNMSVVVREADWNESSPFADRYVTDESNVGTITLTIDGRGDQVLIAAEDRGDEDAAGGIAVTPTITLTDPDSEELVGMVQIISNDPDMKAGHLYGPDGEIVPVPVLSFDANGEPTLGVAGDTSPTGYYVWQVDSDDFTRTGDSYGINGLTFQPAPDSSNDVDYIIRATVSDDGDTLTTQGTGKIIVDAVADAPDAVVGAADGSGLVTGTEDQPIALNLQVAVSDQTLEEIASVQIEDVPEGWQVGYWEGGTFTPADNTGGGVWTLNPDRLDDVAMMPPRDLNILPGDAPTFTLRVVSTETEAPSEVSVQEAETVTTFKVAVQADADAPSLVVANATGFEDTDIALSILARVTDSDTDRGRDASESLQIVVDGDFKGGILVDADGNEFPREADGSYILTPEQAAEAHFRPKEHSNEPVSLSVTAVATEGSNNDTASTTTTFDIRVKGVVDDLVIPADSLDAEGNLVASGTEDHLINPHFEDYATQDVDNAATGASSETLSVVLYDIPDGVTVTMTAGNEDFLRFIGNGRWAVDPEHLDDVRLSVPGNFSGTKELKVDLVVTESDGAVRVTPKTLVIDVEADADAPSVTITAPGIEDQASIPVDIQVNPTDLVAGTEAAEEIVEIRVDFDTDSLGLPPGTVLTIDLNGQTIEVGPGTELVFSNDPGPGEFPLDGNFVDGHIVGLTLHGLPAHWSTDVPVTVTAISEDANGDREPTTVTGKVAIGVEADAPATFTATGGTAAEGTHTVDLGIDFSLTDTDGSETVYLVVENVPANAVLNHGYSAGNGTWIVPFDPSDSSWHLQLTGEEGIDTLLTVKAVITDRDPDSADVDVLETTLETPVHVVIPGDGPGGPDPDVEPPQLAVDIVPALEDGLFALDITVTPGAGSTPSALIIHDLPGDAALVANGDPGQTAFYQVDGKYVIPLNADGTIPVNADGEPVVMIRPPHDMAGPLSLPMSVTATAGSHTVASDDGLADPPVFQVADLAPTSDGAGVSVTLAEGADRGEDAAAMPVAITLTRLDTVVDGGEDLAEHLHGTTITVSGAGLPDGTTLYLNGTELVPEGDGNYVIDFSQFGADAADFQTDGSLVLNGLSVKAPEQYHGGITLTVSVQAADQTAAPVTTQGGLTITVTPETETEASGLVVAGADVTGDEDTAITLDLTAANPDQKGGPSAYGSEVTTVVIKGVPEGAVLSGATNNGTYVGDDGQTYTSWTVKAGNLLPDGSVTGVTLTPPLDFSGDIQLTLEVFTMETSTKAVETTTSSFTVTVEGVADTPSINPQSTRGDEDTEIPLTLDAELIDSSETLEVVFHGVADGARFTDGAGTQVGIQVQVDGSGAVLRNPDGSAIPAAPGVHTGVWVVPGAAVGNLHFAGPTHASGVFTMDVQSVTIDGTDVASSPRVPFLVTLDGVADAPTLTLPAIEPSGTEDDAAGFLLNIGAALKDTEGETLSLRLTGLPITTDGDESTLITADGRIIHPVTDDVTGQPTWVVEGHEIDGLRMVTPEDWNGTVTLGVEARSVEGDTVASTTGTLDITVAGVNDAPEVAFAGNQTGQSFSGTTDLIRVVPGGDGDASDGLNILFSDSHDDGTTLGGLDIQIAAGGQAGDRLVLNGHEVSTDASGAWVVDVGGSSVSMTWDAGTKTLSFSGEASFEAYGELAENVVLVGSDGTLADGQREITFTAVDPDGGTDTASTFTTINGTVTVTGVSGEPGLMQEVGTETLLTGGAGDDSFVFDLDQATGGGHTWTIEGAAGNDQLFIFGQGLEAGDWSAMVLDQDAGRFQFHDATSGQNVLIDLIDGTATLNTDGPNTELVFQGSGEITFDDGSKIVFDDMEKVSF